MFLPEAGKYMGKPGNRVSARQGIRILARALKMLQHLEQWLLHQMHLSKTCRERHCFFCGDLAGGRGKSTQA